MTTTTITWIPVGERLPDDETNVLLGLADGFSCEGFITDGQWYDVTAEPLDDSAVVAWAEMPMCGVAA